MTTQELITLLEDFIHLPGENEVVEFKKAQNGFDTLKLGEYFSALSNEANLSQKESAWLLFGIHDKTHAILGSSYKPTRPSLDALKREIAEGTNYGITFTEIHEIMYQGKRVLIDQKTAYSNNKGFEDSYYCDLILKALTEHGTLTKKEIIELLWNKLPDVLDDDQKYYKVGNLLTKLKKQDKIENISKGIHSDWLLKKG
ncbi:helix-turn-helix domain-containing protein [Bacteroides sp. UBA939]|uniref:AlbA family DNA-binding domain-containing protein n=1 Tax=Bacteroides sp. UBA939 TaxID=1946092 RepID=UPI0025BB03FE|nr:ATP-binding protein [Bacteroides sp. UBA939]